jgi:hypothetical protein
MLTTGLQIRCHVVPDDGNADMARNFTCWSLKERICGRSYAEPEMMSVRTLFLLGFAAYSS